VTDLVPVPVHHTTTQYVFHGGLKFSCSHGSNRVDGRWEHEDDDEKLPHGAGRPPVVVVVGRLAMAGPIML